MRSSARVRRHDVRAEEGRLVGDLAGQAQRALLVVDGEPVAALDLDRRRAEGPHLGDPAAQQAAQLVVGGRPGGRHRDPDAAAVVGGAGHPRGELAPRGRRRRRGGCGCRRTRARRPARPRRPCGRPRGRDAAGPTQATSPSSTTTAASGTIPRRVGRRGDRAEHRRPAVRTGAGHELADAGDAPSTPLRARPPRSPADRRDGVGEQPADVARAVLPAGDDALTVRRRRRVTSADVAA